MRTIEDWAAIAANAVIAHEPWQNANELAIRAFDIGSALWWKAHELEAANLLAEAKAAQQRAKLKAKATQ